MARERITFDGWELTIGQGVRDWEVRDGMDEVSGFLGDNHQIGGRGAEVWRPKRIGAGRFEVGLWLGGSSVSDAQARYRDLVRAVARPWALIRVQRTMADGTVIFCDAELVGGIKPNHIGQLGYRASLTFNVPSGVWLSYDSFMAVTPAGATLPKTLSMPEHKIATAPMQMLMYTITGPITNPKLSDATSGGTGDTFMYKGTVTSGNQLVIRANDWSVTGVGFAPNLGLLFPTGDRLMTVAPPRPGGVPAVKLEGTGGGALTKLQVDGRAAFLC